MKCPISKTIHIANMNLFICVIRIGIGLGVNEMDIAIIGGGSIGLLLSSHLQKNNQVTLYVKRSEQQQVLQEQGIRLLKHGVHDGRVQVQTKVIEEISSDHEVYIVCVKQMQLHHIIDYLLLVSAPVIFLQNGMGHIDQVQVIPPRVYVGIVSHGAHRTADNEVNFLGKGSISIASLTGSEKELKQLIIHLNDAYFPVATVSDWEKLLKDKLVVNAVINPLTALFDVPNGSIITNQHIHAIAKKLCEETANVLGMPYMSAWEKVSQTAEATKENTSSMRADIHNRRQTEIEAISGYILQKSNQKLPYTTFVYHAILALHPEE